MEGVAGDEDAVLVVEGVSEEAAGGAAWLWLALVHAARKQTSAAHACRRHPADPDPRRHGDGGKEAQRGKSMSGRQRWQWQRRNADAESGIEIRRQRLVSPSITPPREPTFQHVGLRRGCRRSGYSIVRSSYCRQPAWDVMRRPCPPSARSPGAPRSAPSSFTQRRCGAARTWLVASRPDECTMATAGTATSRTSGLLLCPPQNTGREPLRRVRNFAGGRGRGTRGWRGRRTCYAPELRAANMESRDVGATPVIRSRHPQLPPPAKAVLPTALKKAYGLRWEAPGMLHAGMRIST